MQTQASWRLVVGAFFISSILVVRIGAQTSTDATSLDPSDGETSTVSAVSATTGLLSITEQSTAASIASPDTTSERTTTSGQTTTSSESSTASELSTTSKPSTSASSTVSPQIQCQQRCDPAACSVALCPSNRDALCINDVCGCNARFLLNQTGQLVDVTDTCNLRLQPQGSGQSTSSQQKGPIIIIVNRPTTPQPVLSTTQASGASNANASQNVPSQTGSEIPVRPDGGSQGLTSPTDGGVNGTDASGNSTRWNTFPTQTLSPDTITTTLSSALPLGGTVNTAVASQAGRPWGKPAVVPTVSAGWGRPAAVTTGWGNSQPEVGYAQAGGVGVPFGSGLFGGLGFGGMFASIPSDIISVLPFGAMAVGANGFGPRLGSLPTNATASRNSTQPGKVEDTEAVVFLVQDLKDDQPLEDELLDDEDEASQSNENQPEESQKGSNEVQPQSVGKQGVRRGGGGGRGNCRVCYRGRASRCALRYIRRRSSFCRLLRRRCLRECW